MNILSGKRPSPYRAVVYGSPGVGKTRFALGVTDHRNPMADPKCLLLDYDSGSAEISVHRVAAYADCSTWEQDLRLADEACTQKGDWTTVVVDTPAPILHHAGAVICAKAKGGKGTKTVGEIAYEEGWHALVGYWREYLHVLERAKDHGRSVILVMHAERAKVKNPALGDYDTMQPSMHRYVWAETNAWAHGVFFASIEGGATDRRIYYTGQRLLHCVEGTGYTAKNRWEMPESIPLDPIAFHRERTRYARTSAEVMASIAAMTPPEMAEKVKSILKQDGDNIGSLVDTERQLEMKLATHRKAVET